MNHPMNALPTGSGEVVFVQFSDQLLTNDPTMRDYYRDAYSKMPGYHFPEHYMEIPFWIPTVAGMLPSDRYEKSLHIVTDTEQSIAELATRQATLMFSVMDANTAHVQNIARHVENKIVMGGYTDPAEYADLPHTRYVSGLEELPAVFGGANTNAGPDYSLFAGEKCIPRLTLSTGCSFKCKFCTVPTAVNEVDTSAIEAQTDALRPLDFDLIFLDDKSFGQADNWQQIETVRDQVAAYNPDFSGFIAQTPPSLALRKGFLKGAIDRGLRYLEIGVETVNDKYLADFKKPFRVHHLEKLCGEARKLGLPLIPNFILGIPGDDYRATIAWVEANKDIIPVVNINFLSAHFGAERGGLPFGDGSTADADQNSLEKSWLSHDDTLRMHEAMLAIYAITRTRTDNP